jgi:hypothetical protein
MPSKVCGKQNTHRAEHLVAESDLGVRKIGVTDGEAHRRHRCCNAPEVQKPVRVPYGAQKEQNAGNSIQPACFHRNFSGRRIGRSRTLGGMVRSVLLIMACATGPQPLGRLRTCRKTPYSPFGVAPVKRRRDRPRSKHLDKEERERGFEGGGDATKSAHSDQPVS